MWLKPSQMRARDRRRPLDAPPAHEKRRSRAPQRWVQTDAGGGRGGARSAKQQPRRRQPSRGGMDGFFTAIDDSSDDNGDAAPRPSASDGDRGSESDDFESEEGAWAHTAQPQVPQFVQAAASLTHLQRRSDDRLPTLAFSLSAVHGRLAARLA